MPSTSSDPAPLVAILQGTYFALTGLWPVLHLPSFEKVTGPKTDDWLVKTVGALITVVGGTLLVTGLSGRMSADMAILGVASAGVLGAVDVFYTSSGRISRIYLADAAAEMILIAMWTAALVVGN